MKKQKQIIALVLAAVLLVSCLTACSSAGSRIKDTLEEFEHACRDLDVDTMLGCIAPDVADPIRMFLALYSGLTDQNYADVTDSALKDIVYGVFDADYNPDDFLSTISVTDVKVELDGSTATVECIINFEIAGEKFARDSAIVMVEERDKWYIACIDLFA